MSQRERATPDPYTLLGTRRGDSDLKVATAFLRALTVHAPANGGSEEARQEVQDAFARVCSERGRDLKDMLALAKPPRLEPPRPRTRRRGREPIAKPDSSAPPLLTVAKPDKSGGGNTEAVEPDDEEAVEGEIIGDPSRYAFTAEDRSALGLDDDGIEALPIHDIKERMHALDAAMQAERLSRMREARLLGLYWIAALKHHGRSGHNMTIQKFARTALGYHYDRLRFCTRVAMNWPSIMAAYAWFILPETQAAGWISKTESGTRFSFDLLEMHGDFLKGRPPTYREEMAQQRKEEAAERAAQKKAEAEAAEEAQQVEQAEREAAHRDEVNTLKQEFDALWSGSDQQAHALQQARRRNTALLQQCRRLRGRLREVSR